MRCRYTVSSTHTSVLSRVCLKAVTDPKQRDAYNAPPQIGSKLAIDPQQAEVVKEIFEPFVAGKSHRAIATLLNQRGVLKPHLRAS